MNTPTDAAVLAGVEDVARRALDWTGSLAPETSLIDALELDSLRMLTLVVELEDHFQICLEEGDEAGLTTVADLVGLLRSRLDAR